jgi:hypothetical protein
MQIMTLGINVRAAVSTNPFIAVATPNLLYMCTLKAE